jgi:hypothetical protein
MSNSNICGAITDLYWAVGAIHRDRLYGAIQYSLMSMVPSYYKPFRYILFKMISMAWRCWSSIYYDLKVLQSKSY